MSLVDKKKLTHEKYFFFSLRFPRELRKFFNSHMEKNILNLENGALKQNKILPLAGRPLKNWIKSLEVKRSQNKFKKSYLPPCLKLDHTLRGTIIPCGYFYLFVHCDFFVLVLVWMLG